MEVNVKKHILIILALMALATALFAQLNDKDIDLRFLTQAQTVQSKVYFGIFTSDLNEDKTAELGYPYPYGLLITSVVDGSPASECGLQDDDIITYINDVTVQDQETFDKIRADLQPGDMVKIGIWRDGNEMEIDMTMQARPEKQVTETVEKTVATKDKSVGYGGGSWIPYWFIPDLGDVNELLHYLGFQTINEDGILMQGLGGKMYVGKGFFVGGTFATYEDTYTIHNQADPSFHDGLSYSTEFGGVTLDKRFALAKHFVASIGFMAGGGGHTVELIHSNADYSWPDSGTEFNSGNYHSVITRSFLTVQPKAELLYNLLPWLGLRAEVGYVYGYAPKDGWRVEGLDSDNFVVNNSPNTPFKGLTLSVGPWFGF